MAKRAAPATSSSSSKDSPSSPKRNKTQENELKDEEVFKCTVTLSQLFDKLNYIDKKMEDHFGSLRTEIASLRYELKDEIEGVKHTTEAETLVSGKAEYSISITEDKKKSIKLFGITLFN